MGQKIKLTGKLRRTMLLLVLMVIPFAALDFLIFYYFDFNAGMICSAFTVVYFVVVLIVRRRVRKVLLAELVDFASSYSTVQRRMMEDFEVAYALLDQDAKVLWMNTRFSQVTGRAKDYRRSIAAVFPQVTKDQIQKNESMELEAELLDRIYRISIQRLNLSDVLDGMEGIEFAGSNSGEEFLAVMYLFDETLQHQYLTEKRDMQMVPALVYIDNFEEVLETVEDVRRALLIAFVDRRVNRYFANLGGIVKKTEQDKYFVVFPHKALDAMTGDNFALLDDVKSIRMGNEISVTLSIGIGDAGDDYQKSYGLSRMAIELALGRAGDQAVIKTKEKAFYYGGSSRQVDKSTRVKARVKALALREIIISKDQFYVMGHQLADVDSFGAAIGIYCAARQLGKKAQIVIDEVNVSLRAIRDCFTPEKGYPEDMMISSERALSEIKGNSALIVVDTNRPSYTQCPQLLDKAKTIVVFDHHRQGEEIIKHADLSYIEPYASSACEMIAEVLQYFDDDGVQLSNAEADAIYAGILIDTNNFMSKTGVRTFEAAAYLRRCGAEVTRVRKMMRNDMNAYKARAEAVCKAEVYRGSYAISACTAENIESPTVACAQAANELLNIVGIKASFVLTEYKGKIYISARSIDEINVQQIMERLGGGGHLNSAGAQLSGCTLEEAKHTVEQTLDEFLRGGLA